mmetsp:Transcript_14397/g.12222  ORF Transcript_14397/g.12222 Transcript_14397/m.12222 type:complete len:158 (+) Transcript_14397:327-800(+)
MVQAYLFSAIINEIKQNGLQSTDDMRILVIMLLVATVLAQYFLSTSAYLAYKANINLKGGLINMIYKKITKIKFTSLQNYKIGKLINLVANDLSQFDNQPRFLSNLIGAFWALIIGSALLYSFFGLSCIPGIAFLIIVIPIQGWLTNKSEVERKNKL